MIKNKIWSKNKAIMLLPTVNMFNIATLLVFSIYVGFIEKNFRPVYTPTVLAIISYLIKKVMLKHLWIMQSIQDYRKSIDIIKSKSIKSFVVWGVFSLLGVAASVSILVKSNVDIVNIEVVHTIASVFSYAIFIGTMVSSVIFMANFGSSLSMKRTVIARGNTYNNITSSFVSSTPVDYQHNAMSHDLNVFFDKPVINPANELPMVNSTTDVHGNLYGFSSHSDSHIDINPASGLSMANSSIDVHGNVYGSSMSHNFAHYNHHHDIHSTHDIHSHYDHYNNHS
ncbi:TPA: hypothetical protein ACPZHQ_002250 [Yersinia enterocolitica]